MEASHYTGVRELDLSNWHANAVAEKLNHAVPAIKSSAAFLSFLRANLALDPITISHTNTPVLRPAANYSPPPSPSSQASDPPLTPLDDIPNLSLEILSHPADKAQALNLISESIVEQRQQTALSLILHPLSIAAVVTAVAVVHHQTRSVYQNVGLAHSIATITIFLLACLAIIHYLTLPYANIASSISPSYLHPTAPSPLRAGTTTAASACDEDFLLAARSGPNIIAAVVLRLEPKQSLALSAGGFSVTGPPSGGKKRSRGSSGNAGPLRGGKGVIRAWTTGRKWRGCGVGADLLHEAVRVTRERCGRDAEVGFALEHVHSKMVLPELFNVAARKQERRAAMALERVIGAWEAARRRK
ncbi:hypothetical protein D7B24_007980 [Verticillium nonalfalfae]|uniref:Uncharacterized protein n=1 Tax=Verticillium nonalfalfae TaxID=1051616 RepID=A0A3M9Y7Z0_9PEZI|nr:uncharacterized protein D7B24_007980 [Verticillium nonalfalfae]RNJ55886.1 hypothetical protein D7B24_007980 [Verticillium nonalfalfae]